MRRLSLLLVLLLILAACTTTEDTDDTVVDEPTPSPTAIVDEEPPEPTPTPEPTPEPTPSPTPTPEPEEDTADLDALLDQVIENVVELRGLELLEELEFALMSREELAEMLEEEIVIEQSDIDLYWIFRLIDERDLDLERMMIDVQAADIYGFYDAETQETYLIAEDDDISAMEEVFLAHEITHALQDQHFGLDLLLEETDDYDRLTAFIAIVEGDAVLTQELYAQTYFDAERMMEYQREALAAIQDQAAGDALDALPRYLIESLSFPYVSGPMFMLLAYDGDLSSLNDLLVNPPASTQQIMNPSAYFRGEIDDPVEVEIPDLLQQLGDDWSLYDAGTLGVFDLAIMLEENGVPDPDAELEWWNGSRFAMYEDGQDVVGIMSSVWDGEDRASAFEALLIETMANYQEEGGIWFGNDRYHTIAIDGDMVTLISASTEEPLLDLIEMN